MLLRILIAPLLIILASYGCDTLKNRTDSIALECGLDQKSVGQNSYLKLLNSQGTGFEAADLPALKSQFRSGQGETKPVPMTSRGCVILPHDAGLLQVFDSRNSESLTLNIGPGAPKREFQTLNLKPKPDIQFRLACPAEGIFASEKFSQPLFINSNGDIAGLDFRLELLNLDNELVRTLHHKPKGSTELSLPETFDIRDITEGTYALKVYGHHLSQGIDSRPQLLSSEKPCILNILHGTVYVGGFYANNNRMVYPPRTRLPWTLQSPHENLYVCKEKRTKTSSGRLEQTSSCMMSNQCQFPSNFKEATTIETDETGVFDYFVFVENKAGIRSDVSCQTVIVSETSPTLSVKWTDEELKRPGSILRKPYAILNAQIETSHEWVDDSKLENSLTCKVDFEIKGKNFFSERGVYCTEGRCKGQSLADFVPCDKQVSFTLVDALNQPILLNSRLRLTVRGNDGAGHSAEAETSLWINQSTWIKDVLPYSMDNRTYSLSRFLLDQSSDIIAAFSGDGEKLLAALTKGQWTPLQFEGQSAEDYYLSRNREGSLRIGRSQRIDDKFKVDVFGYKDSQLIPLAITPNDNLISLCWNFMIGPNDSIYCTGTRINDAFQLIDGSWVKLPEAMNANDSSAAGMTNWRILEDGTVAAITPLDLYLWNGASWKRVIRHALDTKVFSCDLIEDFKGRLWIYAQPSEKNHGLYRIEGERLVLYPSPFPLTKTTGFTVHADSAVGLHYFRADFLRFDFSTDLWINDIYPISLSADLDDRQSWINDANQNFTSLGDKGFFEGAKNPLYWPIKAFGYMPSLGMTSIQRHQNALYFMDMTSTPWQLVRIRSSYVSAFDSNMTGTPASHATGTWDNSEGETVLNFSDGNQYILHEDRIEKQKSPAAFKDTLQVSALPEGRYCISKLSGLWLYDSNRDTIHNFASDSGTGNPQQCIEDRTGKLWWLHASNSTLHTFDGKNSKEVDIQRQSNEELKTLKALQGNSKILLATTRRVLVLNEDGLIEKSMELEKFENAGNLTGFQSLISMTDSTVLLQVNTQTAQKAFFRIDLEKDTIARDHDLEKMVGPYYISKSNFRNGRTYFLTLSPSAVMVVESQGKWLNLGARSDFEHVPAQKHGYPWWFTVDSHERIWFITNRTPSKLGRLDPDLTP
jgi:hypothetical protein